MRRQIAASAAGFAVMLVAACSSDPTPTPTPAPASSAQQARVVGGSEVDRSSAESTALAFARMYAAGDLPHACELANADGRESIGSKCDRQQSWSTTVTLVGQCQSGTETAFHFEAPTGSLNREGDLVVWVNDGAGMWMVAAASTPASTATSPMGCDSTESSSVGSAGSVASTSASG